jgi:hypothetical protein
MIQVLSGQTLSGLIEEKQTRTLGQGHSNLKQTLVAMGEKSCGSFCMPANANSVKPVQRRGTRMLEKAAPGPRPNPMSFA